MNYLVPQDLLQGIVNYLNGKPEVQLLNGIMQCRPAIEAVPEIKPETRQGE
jgi:hypothetical protein